MLRQMREFFLLASALAATACAPEVDYTLYSTDTEEERRHIATFDAGAGEAENRANCHSVAEALAEQRSLRYWCEKGAYRP